MPVSRKSSSDSDGPRHDLRPSRGPSGGWRKESLIEFSLENLSLRPPWINQSVHVCFIDRRPNKTSSRPDSVEQPCRAGQGRNSRCSRAGRRQSRGS